MWRASIADRIKRPARPELMPAVRWRGEYDHQCKQRSERTPLLPPLRRQHRPRVCNRAVTCAGSMRAAGRARIDTGERP